MAQFHLDQCVGRKLGRLLSTLGHDVVHSQDLGMKYATDDAHLLTAASAGRILVSKNGDDFALLHSAWQRWSHAWGVTASHAGILIIAGDWQYADAAPGISTFVENDPRFEPATLFEWKRSWHVGRA